jgi:hypothetical protein
MIKADGKNLSYYTGYEILIKGCQGGFEPLLQLLQTWIV